MLVRCASHQAFQASNETCLRATSLVELRPVSQVRPSALVVQVLQTRITINLSRTIITASITEANRAALGQTLHRVSATRRTLVAVGHTVITQLSTSSVVKISNDQQVEARDRTMVAMGALMQQDPRRMRAVEVASGSQLIRVDPA